MAKDDVKTAIDNDGLRYRSKAPGSPFAAAGNFSAATMSCFLCGKHRPRTTLKSRKLFGKTQFVCTPNCKDASAGPGGAWPARPAHCALMEPIHVLMICTGNICRSPTAEAVLRAKLGAAGLSERVQVDSAGTHDDHVGAPPDWRAQEHAERRGYDLSALRARKVRAADFEHFDLLLAMDSDNFDALARRCPPALRHKLRLLMSFVGRSDSEVVPDPYYGGASGFDQVLDLVEGACDRLVDSLSRTLEPR